MESISNKRLQKMISINCETDMQIFYADIVNNKNLSSIDFFYHIHKRYDSIENLEKIIKKLESNGPSVRAKNIRTILKYHEAIMQDDGKTIEELKPKFDKIEEINLRFKRKMDNPFVSKKIDKDVLKNKLIDEIINYNENKDEMSGKEISEVTAKVRKNASLLDQDMYVDYIISRRNIEKISKKEITQVIEVLDYFIKNLRLNLKELEKYRCALVELKKQIHTYNNSLKSKITKSQNKLFSQPTRHKTLKEISTISNELSEAILQLDALEEYVVENLYVKSYENATVAKMCMYQINHIKSIIKYYEKIREFLNLFVKEMDNDVLSDSKAFYVNTDEDFIKETIKQINSIIDGYNTIGKASLSNEKIENARSKYLKNVYIK